MTSQNVTNSARVIVDVVMLILAALPSMVFKFADIKPTQRGFFCNDESIRYPYHDGTISTPVLILVGGVTNIAAIVICEVLHYLMTRRTQKEITTEKVFNLNINPCLYIICGYIWALGFGMMINQGITDVGKWSIGRLRPHFIDGCIPEGPGLDLTSCSIGEYITNYTCTQNNEKIAHDLRLSFPSGHASLSFYAMVFLAIYIQKRIPRFSLSYLVKHILQFIAILMAWFTTLSRVMDYKHHPTDVLAGGILGTVVALLCTKFVAKGFRNPYSNGPYRRVGKVRSSDTERPGETTSSEGEDLRMYKVTAQT